MEPESGQPKEAGKPEYNSPITYEIKNSDGLWDYISQGTFKASGGDRGRIFMGPYIGKTADRPMLRYEDGEIELHLPRNLEELGSSAYSILRIHEIPNLPEIIKEYTGIDIKIKSGRYSTDIYRILPSDNEENLIKLTSEFNYNPSDSRFHTKEEFLSELNIALSIYKIYLSELYKANGMQIPEEKIVIDVAERSLSKKYSIAFKDKDSIFKLFGTEKKNEIYYPSPGLPKLPDEVFSDLEKLFGRQKDKDIETLRQSIVVEERPDVTFDEIGGQPGPVETAKTLADQISHPDAYLKWGSDPLRGILFFGEPGNGKTLIAKALAHEADCAFVYVKASDLASKWYGDAEKLARGVFTIAREEAKRHKDNRCILFLDEADTLLPSRGGNTHEATRKVIGIILQEIDGLETESGITVVASTNRPDDIDSAFLSRMTEWIEVPNPTPEGIAEILEIHFDKANKKAGRKLLADGVDLSQAVQHITGGISGRDIADIVQIILKNKARIESQGGTSGSVTLQDILNTVNSSSKIREIKKTQQRKHPIGFNPNNNIQ